MLTTFSATSTFTAPIPSNTHRYVSTGRAQDVDKKTVRSWILYDFANSSFTTIVVTFVSSKD